MKPAELTPAHFVDARILNPTNPISVNLIGTGGTGSQMLTALARINHALVSLGMPGISVCAYDDDTITPANLGRQLFTASEIGQYKAAALISRINRFFGTAWKAIPRRYDESLLETSGGKDYASLTISCVDEVPARFQIAEMLTRAQKLYTVYRPIYWMDFGNTRYGGQVLLSTVANVEQPKSKLYRPCGHLPMVTTEFKDLLLNSAQSDNTPSCSLAQALTQQDLFINSTLAQAGASLLWQLLHQGMVSCRGFFLDLSDLRMQPIKISPPGPFKNQRAGTKRKTKVVSLSTAVGP